MTTPLVECTDVRYTYGRREALRGFSAAVGPGLVGLLGPNGAGKSTLFGLLSTLLAPQRGEITIAGDSVRDVAEVRRTIGYLPQSFTAPGVMSVRRVVEYAAWSRGLSTARSRDAAQAAIEAVGLRERAEQRVGSLSGGYRQRLGIAAAVVGGPSLVLLDEPTVGIDPVQRVQIRQLIGRLAASATVVVATHLLEDIELPGATVVVINEGRARFQGRVEELTALGAGRAEPGQREIEAGYVVALGGGDE
ncbi:ABC transporter ATP-binding protein [Salana multivorans]